jgi:hypothetical protein
MKTLKKALGWLSIAVVLGLGITMLAYPASITQLAGLAVAQSSTQWNSLKDMAQGDGQASGVALFSPCLWNGASCDRQRGSTTGGATVTLSNTNINPGSITSVEGTTLQNSTQTSAANTAQTITLTGAASTRVTIDFIEAFLSAAGACTLTIVDNATTVYSHPLTVQVATSQLQVPLGNDGLSISTGSTSTVNVGACGVGITSTLNVVASRQ